MLLTKQPQNHNLNPFYMSADVTKLVDVVEGDTLPNLVNNVYGRNDDGLVNTIAKFNQLNKFRDLQPGTQLIFPPIDSLS